MKKVALFVIVALAAWCGHRAVDRRETPPSSSSSARRAPGGADGSSLLPAGPERAARRDDIHATARLTRARLAERDRLAAEAFASSSAAVGVLDIAASDPPAFETVAVRTSHCGERWNDEVLAELGPTLRAHGFRRLLCYSDQARAEASLD